MDLRETFSGKSGRTAIVGAAVLVVGFVAVLFVAGGSGVPGTNQRAFFSDDDGKTWFADDAARIPPFDHGGKLAVRAYVLRSAKGVEFVNYLERFKPEAKKAMENASKPDPDRKTRPDQAALQKSYIGGREVKRPGDAAWIDTAKYREAGKVMEFKCPDGSTDATPVEP